MDFSVFCEVGFRWIAAISHVSIRRTTITITITITVKSTDAILSQFDANPMRLEPQAGETHSDRPPVQSLHSPFSIDQTAQKKGGGSNSSRTRSVRTAFALSESLSLSLLYFLNWTCSYSNQRRTRCPSIRGSEYFEYQKPHRRRAQKSSSYCPPPRKCHAPNRTGALCFYSIRLCN